MTILSRFFNRQQSTPQPEVISSPSQAKDENKDEKDVAGSPSQKYPKEVQQIHCEFFTAGDRILNDAIEILKKAEAPEIDKAKRLLNCGFTQAKQAKEGDEIIKQAIISKETANLVNYYRLHYPNNKFITENQVKAICFKYNLVCGDVSRYRGFVPENKLKDIEKFKVKDIDKFDTNKCYYFIAQDKHREKDIVWELSNLSDDDISTQSDWFKKRSNGYHYTSSMLKNDIYPKSTRICSSIQFPELLEEFIGLKICAPVKDMDLTGMKIEEGYKAKRIIHIPDPVVLQPVKGGYLIVTAWGDEASDELVVNHNGN